MLVKKITSDLFVGVCKMEGDEFKEHTCDVCENVSYYMDDNRPMVTSYGFKVCSTGCAMRVWTFDALIDPAHGHDRLKINVSGLLSSRGCCECGCKNSFTVDEYKAVMGCKGGARHCKKDRIVPLTDEEKRSPKFGYKSSFRCLDCGEGLRTYEKRLIDIAIAAKKK